MFKFSPLFSSSSGNSIYIGGTEGGILVDAGMSAKQTELALWDIGVDAKSLRAIFVTHEHNDHIKGLRVLAKKHRLPVYGTEGTLAALEDMGIADGSFECRVLPVCGAQEAGLLLESFPTSHDVRESCGYRVTLTDGRCVAIATDLGKITPEVMLALGGCELVLLESNHDVDMLRNGAYPYWLKKRILSDEGHLSNEACAQAAVDLVRGGLRYLVLGHLSKENNHPALAYEHTKAALCSIGARLGEDCRLEVACVAGQPRLVVDI
ncbi:MAG: MBL fold metallo-hydrolase [Clostridium sp.]|jgi:phosphoribosyl 1,2-cyclic phosphodiesterase|nr:MBL fold metallo-hydrolase [Clostridium sp.]